MLNNISKGKTVFLGGYTYIYIYKIVVIKLFNHSCPETEMQRRKWLPPKSSEGWNFQYCDKANLDREQTNTGYVGINLKMVLEVNVYTYTKIYIYIV